MPSIKDVALKAGVGIATVSRVINQSGYVKEATRIKIEKVIKELEFKPNEIARSMTQQKNRIAAFILPNTKHLFFGELLFEVESALYEKNYKLMVCNSSEQLEKELIYIDMLKSNRVDSMILLTNNDIEEHLDKKYRIISFDRIFEGIPCVASDNYTGGKLAAEHLIERGARKFMFIGDDQQGSHTIVKTEVSKRRLAFKETLKKHGYTHLIEVEYPLGNYIDIPDDVQEQVLKHHEVDGIFCISDTVAARVIKTIESSGKRVPEDVKVIGYDGGRSFLNLGKSITSIDQQPQLSAKAIVNIIDQYYNDHEIEPIIITPVKLIVGEST
ncbi:MAG: LacI family DNA-binding transcriptional regulator [Acholeplasmataceae bacterium]